MLEDGRVANIDSAALALFVWIVLRSPHVFVTLTPKD